MCIEKKISVVGFKWQKAARGLASAAKPGEEGCVTETINKSTYEISTVVIDFTLNILAALLGARGNKIKIA